MARQVKNNKGFLILKTTAEEQIEKMGGYGICDSCNSKAKEGYLIPVLVRWYCEHCYQEWIERATNYPEDRAYEKKVFNDWIIRLNR